MCLKQTLRSLDDALSFDDKFVKFALIAAHSAAQSAMTMALAGPNSSKIYKPKHFDIIEFLDALERGDDVELPDLAYFTDLYKRLFDANDTIALNKVKALNEARNGMVHVLYSSHLFGVDWVLNHIETALSLVTRSQTASRSLFAYHPENRAEIKKTMVELKLMLERIRETGEIESDFREEEGNWAEDQ